MSGAQSKKPRVYISVDQSSHSRGLQISINIEDENGNGHGYRIAGPKYDGSGRTLVKHYLDARDVSEIRGYLNLTHEEQR